MNPRLVVRSFKGSKTLMEWIFFLLHIYPCRPEDRNQTFDTFFSSVCARLCVRVPASVSVSLFLSHPFPILVHYPDFVFPKPLFSER